jgi:hypothetical protein
MFSTKKTYEDVGKTYLYIILRCRWRRLRCYLKWQIEKIVMNVILNCSLFHKYMQSLHLRHSVLACEIFLSCTSARQKNLVRFTGKCMMYSLCQLPPNSPYFYLVWYDLNVTRECHRFYYLPPFTVFDSFSHPFLPCQCLFSACGITC